MGQAIGQLADSGGSSGVGQAIVNSSPFLSALQNIGQGVGVAAQTPNMPTVGSAGVGTPGPVSPIGSNGQDTSPYAPGSPRDVQAYIAQQAPQYGVDPNIALKVFNGEAAQVFDANKPDRGGDGGSSFGPTQLHYGGMNPSMNHPGLGDEFTRQTGLDARDPSTWKQQVDFSLNYAGQHGWGSWMSAANNGVGNFQGINGYPQSAPGAYQNALANGPKPLGLNSAQGQMASVAGAPPQVNGLIGEMNAKTAAAQNPQTGQTGQGQQTPLTPTQRVMEGLFSGRGRGMPQIQQAQLPMSQPAVDTGAEDVAAASQNALNRVAQSTMTPTTTKQASIQSLRQQQKAQV